MLIQSVKIDKTIKTIESDFAYMKTIANPFPSITSIKSLMLDIKDQKERSKNLIIIWIPEQSIGNIKGRVNVDKSEVLKIKILLVLEFLEPHYVK